MKSEKCPQCFQVPAPAPPPPSSFQITSGTHWPCGHSILRIFNIETEKYCMRCSAKNHDFTQSIYMDVVTKHKMEIKAIAETLGITVIHVHDEVMIDVGQLSDEQINVRVDQIMEQWRDDPYYIPILPAPVEIGVDYGNSDTTVNLVGVTTGRMSCDGSNANFGVIYPRELDEELCVGCARRLATLRRDVPSVAWRAYHIIPEEGSEYYCRRAFHRAQKDMKKQDEVLKSFIEPVPDSARLYKMPAQPGKSTALVDQLLELIKTGRPYLLSELKYVESIPPLETIPVTPKVQSLDERLREEQSSQPMTKKMEKKWKLYWLYSQPSGFDEELLNKFQGTQQIADRRNPLFQTSKDLLEKHPEASTNWSMALRIKVAASKAKEKELAYKTDNAFWDPYGDGED